MVKRLLLASPRGYCAGVERAVETVERALALYGSPVYVRKQIVHNSHVVEDLRTRGAIFVDALADVPEGATVVFSAHGVAPAVRREADGLRLTTIDATCPLVTKVHAQARRYAAAGYSIVLIGHAGHEEVEGTLGEAPEAIVLVQSTEEAERVSLPPDRPLAYVTQTTLSVDETGEIVAVLRHRFPRIEGPAREDICYATSNRQWAVKELLREVDLLLVVEGAGLDGHLEEVADELRVKAVELGPVEAVELRVKPNLPKLGPKLGKELGAVREALTAGEFEELPDGRFRVAGHELEADEVLVERGGREGWAVASGDGVTVALDLGLDDELVLEGEAYELIHRVNSLRKERGFELTDRIVLTVPEADRELTGRHGDWIKREVLATELEIAGEELKLEKS